MKSLKSYLYFVIVLFVLIKLVLKNPHSFINLITQ